MEEEEDRMSKLPDEIIHLILSWLPTVLAVQSSILSKRWRYLWRSLPYLWFEPSQQLQGENFHCFVDAVLLLRDKSADIISFYLEEDSSAANRVRVTNWIRHALMRNIQHLYLYLLTGHIPIFKAIFACKTLKSLELDGGGAELDAASVDAVHLGGLTTVYFGSISFKDNSLGKLINGCPNLEDLESSNCWIEEIDASSTSLKAFSLLFGDSRQISVRTLPSIRLNAPNLSSLKIDIREFSNAPKPSPNDHTTDVSTKIMEGLHHVKVLELASHTIEHLCWSLASSKELPTFCNLKTLKISASLCEAHIQAITCLLCRCPKLVSLFVDVSSEHHVFEYMLEVPVEMSSKSFLERLKSVEISNFVQNRAANKLMKLLLTYANSLEQIVIKPPVRSRHLK